MIGMSEYSAEFRPAKILIRIMHLGGKFSKVPDAISQMLNGLKYYSLELRLNEDRYYIQAYEQEAIEPYNLVIEIRDKYSAIKNQSFV